MVENDTMSKQVAEQLNKKSLIRFHAKITKILTECNIMNIKVAEDDKTIGEKIETILKCIVEVQE